MAHMKTARPISREQVLHEDSKTCMKTQVVYEASKAYKKTARPL
jgi:hypothetical protein